MDLLVARFQKIPYSYIPHRQFINHSSPVHFTWQIYLQLPSQPQGLYLLYIVYYTTTEQLHCILLQQ
jgi:hypothetical protein